MKILVTVKRVIDAYVKIRVKSDHSGVEKQNVKMAMNPFDEIALEEALRFREKNQANEVVLLSIGGDEVQETLRHGLALGADRAILVRTSDTLCGLNVAKVIQKIVLHEKPELVLMGKQAIDSDNNQTPQMLAALLHWSLATYASNIQFEDNHLLVTREVDGGLETLKLALPAVVSADLRLNEPRYASLPNIMKAKQKPIHLIALEDLGLSLKKHSEILSVTPPLARSSGVMVDSVESLVEKLMHEAKVL